jgi:hypothetical protein
MLLLLGQYIMWNVAADSTGLNSQYSNLYRPFLRVIKNQTEKESQCIFCAVGEVFS